MTNFWGKILGPNLTKQITDIISAKILSKFCLHKFSPKLNPIWEKRVLNLKFNAFCPVNLYQHCIWNTVKNFVIDECFAAVIVEQFCWDFSFG